MNGTFLLSKMYLRTEAQIAEASVAQNSILQVQ